MLRTGLVVIGLILALQCQASAQGFLDSIFGPSGLGLWGDNFTSQFNSPDPSAAGNQMPGQMPYQGYPQAPGSQQQYYPSQQGYPPQGPAPQGQGYYQQPGAAEAPQQYSDPQQYGAPQQYGPQQYSPQQYSPQQQAPVQQVTPQQQAAPTGGQRASRAQRAPAASAPRPGQYSPTAQPGAPGQLPIAADDLPPGAVSISTTTPEGTRVEYYPPPGEQAPPAGVLQRPRQKRQSAASPAQPRHIKPREETSVVGPEASAAPIAMPKPMEIPGGQDPRSGWGGAVNQAPRAPSSR